MYVRSEKRPWRILGKLLRQGEVLPITAEQLRKYNHLVASGDLSVLADHPDQARKKAASRRKSRTARKKEQLKSDENNG